MERVVRAERIARRRTLTGSGDTRSRLTAGRWRGGHGENAGERRGDSRRRGWVLICDSVRGCVLPLIGSAAIIVLIERAKFNRQRGGTEGPRHVAKTNTKKDAPRLIASTLVANARTADKGVASGLKSPSMPMQFPRNASAHWRSAYSNQRLAASFSLELDRDSLNVRSPMCRSGSSP